MNDLFYQGNYFIKILNLINYNYKKLIEKNIIFLHIVKDCLLFKILITHKSYLLDFENKLNLNK